MSAVVLTPAAAQKTYCKLTTVGETLNFGFYGVRWVQRCVLYVCRR
jgi:hypothetical protein